MNNKLMRVMQLRIQYFFFWLNCFALLFVAKIPKYSLARASVAVNGDESKQINNICMQDVNTGKCTEAHLRYFYDHRVSTCRLFYYSGCGGNENNFATEEECRQQCKSGKYDS